MAKPPTILIVDDDPAIRKMLVEVLSLEGYSTETAANGREALDRLAQSNSPRIVLLDLLMPVIDGRGVMEALATTPEERARHKIILVSAWINIQASQDLQPDGILAKPFTVNQRLNVLDPITAKV